MEIIDARPRVNARANQAKGAGTEIMTNYPNCKLTFQDIGNIHVMRESLQRLSEACAAEDYLEGFKWLSLVESSGWLQHIARILQASHKIIELLDKKAVSVLIHCSDGWDRTPQLVRNYKH